MFMRKIHAGIPKLTVGSLPIRVKEVRYNLGPNERGDPSHAYYIVDPKEFGLNPYVTSDGEISVLTGPYVGDVLLRSNADLLGPKIPRHFSYIGRILGNLRRDAQYEIFLVDDTKSREIVELQLRLKGVLEKQPLLSTVH